MIRYSVGGEGLAQQPRKRKWTIDPATIRCSLDLHGHTTAVRSLTQPKEFVFATAYRSRPTQFLSPEEREQLELIENHTQFRANPVPVQVFASHNPLPLANKPAPTVPKSPAFHTTARLGKKRRIEGPPTSAEQHVSSRRSSTALSSSVAKQPRPFQLMTDLRGKQAQEALERAREEERRREEQQRTFRARPLPSLAPSVTKPSNQESKAPKATRPKPFSLSTNQRGQEKQKTMAQRLQEEEKELKNLRHFKARPLPCGPAFVLQPSSKPLTEPKPFPLSTEERGAVKVTQLQEKLAQEEEQHKENRCFVAAPLPCGGPFKPRPSNRPLTVLQEFPLASNKRAEQRAAFDAQLKAKEAAEAEAQRIAQIERERQERKAIKRLRHQLTHKARAIPLSVYQPMVPLPSDHPLTDPASPCLGPKKRRGLWT